MYLCLCSHEYDDHLVGVGEEPCTHWCGCSEYRLDARSPVRSGEDAATEGAA